MATSKASFLTSLLHNAQAGDQSAFGVLLEAFRDDMKVAAEEELGKELRTRVDASDVVQQSCLSAVREFGRFRGRTPAEFAVWLKQIHARNLLDVVRHHKLAGKRDVRREAKRSAIERNATLGQTGTPSRNAIRAETREQLLRVLQTLPNDQQEVVRLRYFDGWPVREIAARISRSEDAVGGLLRRGLRSLRQGCAGQSDR